ncbi:type VI secretion system protein VasL [Enterobacter cancerogenus]|uniref:Type VI secretion system protein VasL n=1 Tax=Enterobacter cancerogenus TaxID=69218 RepID=A0A484YXU1_9ENTR|nr:type VI secretion system protein VasL [Enterobacter cancerogenus]
MNKLTHPARPDVNWQLAETLCLSLFEHNGIELQTTAWYTLARTHLAGLYGMNEGLAILATLVARQWGEIWPQPVHAPNGDPQRAEQAATAGDAHPDANVCGFEPALPGGGTSEYPG